MAVEEAKADVMVGHDTGCITTLDENSSIGKAVDKVYALPIFASSNSPHLRSARIPTSWRNLPWHASPFEGLFESFGIDWQKAKIEFERYLDEVKAGGIETLYDPKRAITSGPGYVEPRRRSRASRSRGMNRPVLVVGGGPSGLSAAHALARPGSAWCWSTRPTSLAARRSSATPNWCRAASGPRTRSAAS